MSVNKNLNEQEIKSLMPEGLSFFTQSTSPDWVKERELCALCASVVRLDHRNQPIQQGF